MTSFLVYTKYITEKNCYETVLYNPAIISSDSSD